MRLEQLEYLVAVARHGSLRRAGESLHVSQPALSEALTKLERELGVSLLERRRSGSRVSRRGRDLMPHLTQVLDAVSQLRVAAGEPGELGRVVRIGTVNAATSSVLAPALVGFRDAWPTARVEVRDERQGAVLSGVDEGTLDLGLVNLLDGDDVPTGVTATTLMRGHPVVVVPAGHRLATLERVHPDDLAEQPLVLMREGYVMHRLAHRLLGTSPTRATVTTDGATMGKTLVAEGLGVTVLPDYSVAGDPLERAGVISARPLDTAERVSLVLVQRRRQEPALAARALVDALATQARACSVQRESPTA